MKFSCEQCHAQYMIADEKVGPRGVKVKCKKCSHIIVVKPLAIETEAESPAPEVETPPPPEESAPQGFSVPSPPTDTPSPPAAEEGQMGGAFDSLFGQESATPPSEDVVPPPEADPPAAATSSFFGSAPALGQSPVAAEMSAESTAPQSEPPVEDRDDEPGLDLDFSTDAPDEPAPETSRSFGEESSALADRLGEPEGEPASPAPSAREPGEKEWYVAIEDAQVGPVDLAEIEQRWDALEIESDSLAWKAGMSDWASIADIPELSYLVTERPQATAPVESTPGSGVGTSAGSSAAVANLSPVAFGGDGEAAADVAWKPSAASALSSLVQEELVAKDEPAAVESKPATPAGMPNLGMPGVGVDNLFGAGAGAGAGSAAPAAPSFSPQPGFAGPAAGFSMPSPRPSGGGFKVWHLFAFVLGLGVLGLLGFVAWQLTQKTAGERPPGDAAMAAAPATEKSKDVEKKTEAPASAGGAKAKKEDRKGRNERTQSTRESPKRTTATARRSSKTNSRSAPKPSPKKSKGDGLDDLFSDSKTSSKAPEKEKITIEDIVQGVKKNASKVMPCLKSARSKGEIVPGTYKLILDWNIKPSGTVTGGRLKGPSNVMGTSLPGCFSSAMRKWSFPSSRKGAPVKNFPFGPFTVK